MIIVNAGVAATTVVTYTPAWRTIIVGTTSGLAEAPASPGIVQSLLCSGLPRGWVPMPPRQLQTAIRGALTFSFRQSRALGPRLFPAPTRSLSPPHYASMTNSGQGQKERTGQRRRHRARHLQRHSIPTPHNTLTSPPTAVVAVPAAGSVERQQPPRLYAKITTRQSQGAWPRGSAKWSCSCGAAVAAAPVLLTAPGRPGRASGQALPGRAGRRRGRTGASAYRSGTG